MKEFNMNILLHMLIKMCLPKNIAYCLNKYYEYPSLELNFSATNNLTITKVIQTFIMRVV